MNFGNGIYLTPQNRPEEPEDLRLLERAPRRKQAGLGGLVYNASEEIVVESIDPRFSSVEINHVLPLEDKSSDEFLFLGYYFRHYGHFILETLPMLAYCIDDKWLEYKKIFLPYFLSPRNIANNIAKPSNLNLIYNYIYLLGIDPSKIYFHTNYSNLKSNFIVPPKAVSGDRFRIDGNLHAKVIEKIKLAYPKNEPTRKVLALRKPHDDRMTSTITESINTFATNNSIDIIDMGSLSPEQQIRLMHETKYLIGFSGSGMHNSMFLQPQATAINICDYRDFKAPKSYIPNQKLCNRVSRCQEYFIDFKCQPEMNKEYFTEPNNKLTSEQEKFAVEHIINELKTILK